MGRYPTPRSDDLCPTLDLSPARDRKPPARRYPSGRVARAPGARCLRLALRAAVGGSVRPCSASPPKIRRSADPQPRTAASRKTADPRPPLRTDAPRLTPVPPSTASPPLGDIPRTAQRLRPARVACARRFAPRWADPSGLRRLGRVKVRASPTPDPNPPQAQRPHALPCRKTSPATAPPPGQVKPVSPSPAPLPPSPQPLFLFFVFSFLGGADRGSWILDLSALGILSSVTMNNSRIKTNRKGEGPGEIPR